MKKISFCFPLIVLLCTCALEGANVTGPAGGFVFYDKGSYSDGWRYLEASPKDAGEAKWCDDDYSTKIIETSTGIGKGKENADLLIAEFKTLGISGTAAHLCKEFSYGGYTDWFLPSDEELKQIMKTAKYLFKNSEYRDRCDEYWSSTGNGYIATVVYKYNDEIETATAYLEKSCKVRPARRF